MREGVKFQSGNPVTAADAEFSLRRAVILKKTPSFILTQFGFTPENIEQTIKADGNKLSITTDRKYATSFVLNCLTATIGGIVDMKTVMANEADGDMGNLWLKTNSAGAGAYSVVNWKPNESVTLQANEDFYLGAPAMKRVIVRHVQESATQRLLLEKGDIDIARNLNPEDIAGASKAEGIVIDNDLRGRLMYTAVNQKHPELSKPKVRLAMRYLVDYEGMKNSFLKGQYAIHQAFLPQTYLGALEAQERIEISQSLQNTFAQVGIKLNITVGTAKQILTRYRARELDMYMGAWGPDYPDPQTNAGTFAYNPDNSDEVKATGLLAYRNAWDPGDMNQAVEAAVIEPDREKRAQMYMAMQRKHQMESPFTVMFQKIEQTARSENVKNFNIGGAITAAAYWKVTK
jgi:peptide/nickel transport system substrate-binding protein